MFKTASADRYEILKEFARKNRKNATEAEYILWQYLRRDALGYKFLRQHIIGDWIADFVCLEKHLIIEVDGGYHSEHEQIKLDTTRTEALNEMGFSVVRFKNEEIYFDINKVLETIEYTLKNIND